MSLARHRIARLGVILLAIVGFGSAHISDRFGPVERAEAAAVAPQKFLPHTLTSPGADRNYPNDEPCPTGTYTVPAGVYRIQIVAIGGKGGQGWEGGIDFTNPGNGGLGAKVTAVMTVTPGQRLYVAVGGNANDGLTKLERTFDGASGFAQNAGYPGGGPGGGGGGGVSFVATAPLVEDTNDPYICKSGAMADLLVVAGGGGGGGDGHFAHGGGNGAGGGTQLARTSVNNPWGANGFNGSGGNGPGTSNPGGGGGGGTLTAGGGAGSHPGCGSEARTGGSFFKGGFSLYPGIGENTGGGGGGGLYGGGAGGGGDCFTGSGDGGGGGGSSYVIARAVSAAGESDTAGSPYVEITDVTSADLSIGKTVATCTGCVGAPPGRQLTYTVTATNAGPDPAHNTVMNDPLPTGLTFVSLDSTGASGWNCTKPAVGSNGAVRCTISPMPVGSAVFKIVVKINPSLTTSIGTSLTNSATITSDTNDPSPPTPGASAITVTDPMPKLTHTLTLPAKVKSGSELVFTFVVTNSGNVPLDTITLGSNLPAGLRPVTTTPTATQGSCSYALAGQRLSCNLGGLGSGAQITVTARLQVIAMLGTNLCVANAVATANALDANAAGFAVTKSVTGCSRVISP